MKQTDKIIYQLLDTFLPFHSLQKPYTLAICRLNKNPAKFVITNTMTQSV